MTTTCRVWSWAIALCGSMSASGCGVPLDGRAPLALQAFDPELLSHAQSLVFGFSTRHTCADLIDLRPAELDARFAEEKSPVQVVTLPGPSEHVFGLVTPDVPVAYLVAASAREVDGERLTMADFAGTVFAMGCSDLAAEAGTRHDVPVQMFPVGLR